MTTIKPTIKPSKELSALCDKLSLLCKKAEALRDRRVEGDGDYNYGLFDLSADMLGDAVGKLMKLAEDAAYSSYERPGAPALDDNAALRTSVTLARRNRLLTETGHEPLPDSIERFPFYRVDSDWRSRVSSCVGYFQTLKAARAAARDAALAEDGVLADVYKIATQEDWDNDETDDEPVSQYGGYEDGGEWIGP